MGRDQFSGSVVVFLGPTSQHDKQGILFRQYKGLNKMMIETQFGFLPGGDSWPKVVYKHGDYVNVLYQSMI